MNSYIEWKWSKNESYPKSRRPVKQVPDKQSENNTQSTQSHSNDIFPKEIEVSAYTSALNHDENTWDILNQDIYNGFSNSNKREDLDNKMADREMTQQIGFNPFMSENNYANDISVSNTFLKPVNTTLEREKMSME